MRVHPKWRVGTSGQNAPTACRKMDGCELSWRGAEGELHGRGSPPGLKVDLEERLCWGKAGLIWSRALIEWQWTRLAVAWAAVGVCGLLLLSCLPASYRSAGDDRGRLAAVENECTCKPTSSDLVLSEAMLYGGVLTSSIALVKSNARVPQALEQRLTRWECVLGLQERENARLRRLQEKALAEGADVYHFRKRVPVSSGDLEDHLRGHFKEGYVLVRDGRVLLEDKD